MTTLSVCDALQHRRSVREFSDRAVTEDTLRELLQFAGRAPSGGNIQPWKVYAVTGEIKQRLCQATMQQAASSPTGIGADIPIYPPKMADPWHARRAASGEVLYSALNIPREDKMARFQQAAKNMSFFNAPVGLFVTMDRSLCQAQMIDLGLFVQSLLLAAHEMGLATCPQAAWTMWAGVIREQLQIADDEMITLGIALGYAADNQPINNIQQPRIAVDEFATLLGFTSEV